MNFLRNALMTFLANAGTSLLGLLTGVLLARTLGPTGRGLMTTVAVWPAMLVWAGGLSLGFANIYYGAADPPARRRLFANSCWAALALGSLIGLAALFLLPRLVPLTARQHLLLTISLATLSVGIWADYANALLYGTGRFDRLGAVRTLAPVVTALCLLSLWSVHRLTVTTAVVATWAGGWCQLGLTLRFLARDGYVGLRPDWHLLKRSFSYSSRIHVGTLANLANGRLDQLVMTAVVAPKALGLYAFAVTLSEILKQVTGAISTVLFPKMAGETDEAARRAWAIRTARWTMLSGLLCAALVFAFAPEVVRLLWGARFAEAVPTARVLLPGTVAAALAGTMTTSLNGAGRPGVGTVAELASLVVMAPLLWLLLPRLGIFGAGLASTVGYCANLCVVAVCFARIYGRGSLREIGPTRQDWQEAGRIFHTMRERRQRAQAVPQ